MTGTAIVTMTGEQNLDALLRSVKWDGIVASYGFPGAKEDYAPHLLYGHPVKMPQGLGWANETDGFSPLNEDQKDAARNAFAAVDSYVNLTPVEQELAPGSADMRLAMSTVVPGNEARTIQPLSYSPLGAYQGGDIWFNTMDFNNPQLGTGAYLGFFHEIGHALGFKHGHEAISDNNTILADDRDSLEFSIMTYHSYVGQPDNEVLTNADGHWPQTFMMLDIAALQHMYGADFNTNAGDTTYSFNPVTAEMKIDGVSQGIPIDHVLFRTIWDGGGNDTYDFSTYGPDLQLDINLAPGSWTDVDRDSNWQAANLNRDSLIPGQNSCPRPGVQRAALQR